MEEFKLYNNDCMGILGQIPSQSIDLVVCDPPYGTTSIEWDSVLDFSEIWGHLERLMKPKTNAIFFGSQPFTSNLVLSKEKWFKYELVWNKNKTGSPGLAKHRPLKVHENILVFANGPKSPYNPIMETGASYERNCKNPDGYGTGVNTHGYGFGKNKLTHLKNDGTRYPKSVIHASRNFSAQQTVHPTQKPTNVLNWIIMTYSNPGDTVLDFTMGGGSTGVSCKMTNRNFIGIEKEEKYYEIARQRIECCTNKVTREDAQLTTQIHKDMQTVPSVGYESEYRALSVAKTEKATNSKE